MKIRITAIFAFIALASFAGEAGARPPAIPPVDVTQAKAIAHIRDLIDANAGACRITHTASVAASRVKAGWRVLARIKISDAHENAIWIVNRSNTAIPQNQLTAEIEKGCP